MQESHKIVIVGGGSSGLSMAGALQQHGLPAVILDAGSRTGDVWRNRYDRLHLHTIRSLSHCTHGEIPDSYPRYIGKETFADYLRDYARQKQLDIRYNTGVTRISKSDNTYLIETENGDTFHAEHCIIATGVNREPFIPEWKNREDFQGTITHAIHHKTGKDYAGQRVLVVGIGNTGAEICVDCVENGATLVHNSIRTFPTIVPRNPLGIPLHTWAIALFKFPEDFKDKLLSLITRVQLGDLTQYGLKTPQWTIFKDRRIPMIDVGYANQLKRGNINVQPDIECFTSKGVQFVDGTKVEYDTVIAATGYRTGLEKILDIPGVLDETGKVIAENGANAPHKNLWFIGLGPAPVGVLMVARLQSLQFASLIAESYSVHSG